MAKEVISGAGIQFVIDPSTRDIARAFKKVLGVLQNNEKAFQMVSVYLDRWVQDNFKTEGGKVGGWKPFAPNNSRKKKDPMAKLLQDTGALRASFKPFSSRNNAGIGSFLPYARTHNEGFGHIPQRRILPHNYEVWPEVLTMFSKWLQKNADLVCRNEFKSKRT